MYFNVNKRSLLLKENSIFFKLDLANSKEFFFSDMKRVVIEEKRGLALPNKLTITSFFILISFAVLLYLDLIFIFLTVVSSVVIFIKSQNHKSYMLKIYPKYGDILDNDIPRKLKDDIFRSLHDIRKGVYLEKVSIMTQ